MRLYLLPVPHCEALVLPNIVVRTTQKPHAGTYQERASSKRFHINMSTLSSLTHIVPDIGRCRIIKCFQNNKIFLHKSTQVSVLRLPSLLLCVLPDERSTYEPKRPRRKASSESNQNIKERYITLRDPSAHAWEIQEHIRIFFPN